MQISDFDAMIGGSVVIIGYFLQKYVEYKRSVSDKKLETYSMILKSMFAAIESRRSGKNDNSDEIFWKSQLSLYGSDNVIKKYGNFAFMLPRKQGEEIKFTGEQVHLAFDELMLAMRADITANSEISIQEIRKVSPLH